MSYLYNLYDLRENIYALNRMSKVLDKKGIKLKV